MTAPLARVSVIVPSFNGERYLEAALRSALDQTLPPTEVIVVDDGSTDRSAEIAESFGDPVRCLRQANSGIAEARNRGLSSATGELIAFLDQDDVWPPRKLEAQVEALRANPEVGVVSGRMQVIDGALPGRPWSARGRREAPAGTHLGAALIRRSVFDRIGPLDEDVGRGADDVEWLVRARDLGVRRLNLDEVTLLYRWHGGNTSSDIDSSADGQIEAVKRSLDRRRQRAAPVSVVIPVLDGALYLGEAIDSVLGQTRAPQELVVVDDGSGDATPEVIASYGDRIRGIRQERGGNARATNRGVAATSGEYVAFCDADDVWTAGKLAIQLELLEGNEDLEAAFGLVQQFLSEDADPSLADEVVIPTAPQPGVIKSAMLVRRRSLDRVGPFDETQSNADFTDWYLRAMEQGLTSRVAPVVVARRRIHGANLGIREQERQWPATLGALKASLDRRRAG